MKPALSLALLLAIPAAARADEAPPPPPKVHAHVSVDTGLVFLDAILNLTALGLEIAALEDHAPQEPQPLRQDGPVRAYGTRRPPHDARQGLLLSFGLGGGSLYSSADGKAGAFDVNFRLGYGFSDRFQLFGDVTFDSATLPTGQDVASWTLTMRGQTVLAGDRDGNGLNLNLGIGLGGLTRQAGTFDESSSASGLALAGGLSYDARLGHFFALSPEFFVSWHAVPNRPGLAQDIATSVGLRLNFLWYLQ